MLTFYSLFHHPCPSKLVLTGIFLFLFCKPYEARPILNHSSLNVQTISVPPLSIRFKKRSNSFRRQESDPLLPIPKFKSSFLSAWKKSKVPKKGKPKIVSQNPRKVKILTPIPFFSTIAKSFKLKPATSKTLPSPLKKVRTSRLHSSFSRLHGKRAILILNSSLES